MTERVYAVGDVHGRIDLLDAALGRIEADRDRAGGGETVLLGDLVDRGPESRAVIERAMTWHDPDEGRHVVLGNHDRMFAWFHEERPRHDPHLFPDLDWLHPRLGGWATLGSYGVDVDEGRVLPDIHAEARGKVPPAHLDWVRRLPLHVERKIGARRHLFVHAGIRPRVPLHKQFEADLVWIREPFLGWTRAHPWLVVHGHTVVETPHHAGNRVALDTGAAFRGPLTAAVFEPEGAFVLGEDGRVPLDPED